MTSSDFVKENARNVQNVNLALGLLVEVQQCLNRDDFDEAKTKTHKAIDKFSSVVDFQEWQLHHEALNALKDFGRRLESGAETDYLLDSLEKCIKKCQATVGEEAVLA